MPTASPAQDALRRADEMRTLEECASNATNTTAAMNTTATTNTTAAVELIRPFTYLHPLSVKWIVDALTNPPNATNATNASEATPIETRASDLNLTLPMYDEANVTMWRGIVVHVHEDDDDDEIDCGKYKGVPYVYMARLDARRDAIEVSAKPRSPCAQVSTPIWFFLTVIWCYHTLWKHSDCTKDLHRLLTWVPCVQA